MEKILISGLSQAGSREDVLQDSRESSGQVGVWTVSFPTATLKTEQEGVSCPDSVFVGMLRHITHAAAQPVTYEVLL